MKNLIILFFLLPLMNSCNSCTSSDNAGQADSKFLFYEMDDLIPDVATTDTITTNDDVIPDESTLNMWRSRINIAYNQSIEDYELTVICSPNQLQAEGFASAMMIFTNELSGVKLYAFNPYFSDKYLRDNELEFAYNDTITLDYNPSEGETGFYHYAPFQFRDVDFDGTKELLINNWESGQRGCNIYDVYKIKGNRLELLQIPPFDRIDDLTEIDSSNKTIIINYTGGASSWTKEYYQLKSKGIFELTKKEELGGYSLTIETTKN